MKGMRILWLVLGVAGAIALLVLLIAFICFRMAFYAQRKNDPKAGEYKLPQGKIYEPYWEKIKGWIDEMRAMPHEDVSITSFDGLTLRGRYYEYAPGAPIELMLHGYRSTSESDMSGGVQRCFALGRSALLVDQRACGRSEGNVITMGICESRDCRSWVEFMTQKFGPDAKIILTGMSMGAATVLMAAGKPLPNTVVGVIADCGYTSAREIMQKVIVDMHLPPKLAYPFVKLGAKLYGRFDLEADSPIEAMARCQVPVIFIHGEADDFVPCSMSRENFDACVAPKRLVTIPGAGHGLASVVGAEKYMAALREFDETISRYLDRCRKDQEYTICDECGSEYLKSSSKMDSLCPECAHILYGYPNCEHVFEDGRCIHCYWNGKSSAYIKGLKQK